jgi:transposase
VYIFTVLNANELSIPDDILELKALVRLLLDRISALDIENATLKAENAELRNRLNLDSHNSSKPPSSDGLVKRPAFPREKNGKQGGQQNHNGSTLQMVKEPDRIVICKTDRCSCGCDLTQAPTTIIARRQEFDLPEPRLEVTEYRIAQNTCPRCRKIHKGKFPEGINAQAQYGTGVKALVTLLNSEYKLPFERIQTLFQDLYGYAINESTIYSANAVCHDKLADTQALIQEEIIGSPTVNSDESGIRCNGKLHWLHVASTPLFTYLFVHPKRGKEAIESEISVLKRFFGWLVHDCWSSYFNLQHLKHAVCGAHLLRELQALMEAQSQWAASCKAFLLETYNTPLEERLEKRAEIEQRYDTILQQAQKEEPGPIKTGFKGKYKRTKGRNLLERLQKFKSAVLAFAFNAEVPFTNNQAERDIRPVKVKQKISGCFRTFKGAEHYARIAGFISTTRKHKLNVFKELCNVFNGYSFLTIEHAK